jgi:hypothetical protein
MRISDIFFGVVRRVQVDSSLLVSGSRRKLTEKGTRLLANSGVRNAGVGNVTRYNPWPGNWAPCVFLILRRLFGSHISSRNH